MIHPSSSEDEEDVNFKDISAKKEKVVKKEPAHVATAVARKNSVRSQAMSDSSASFPESSHSSVAPSPSPSTTSEEADVRAQQEKREQRLKLYVVVARCIAYPCSTDPPSDAPKRKLKIKKEHLVRIRNHLEKVFAEKRNSKLDKVFCTALSSCCKKFINTQQLDSLVLSGGCALPDLLDMFRSCLADQSYWKVMDPKNYELKNLKQKQFFTLVSKFEGMIREVDGDLTRPENPNMSTQESSKEQLYDMFQNIIGINQYEHQMIFSACQLDNTDEQAAAIRRELRGRIKTTDRIEREVKYPVFFKQEGRESELRVQYLNGLRGQINGLITALEQVPLANKTSNGKPALRKFHLPSLPSSDHSAEEEMSLSKSDVIMQFPYEVIVVEVLGLKSVAPTRLIYCTMEVGGSREKLQTDLVPVSKPVWESQGDFTSTHPLSVIKVKLFVKNTGMLAIEDKELGRTNLLWCPGLNSNKTTQCYDMFVPKNSPDKLQIKLSVSMERPLNMKQAGYMWAKGTNQWKVWKKRFFMLVQVSQYNFALCSYVERRTEPVAMVQLNGYVVDYSAPEEGNNKIKIFFKITKEGNCTSFGSDDYQEGVLWVQAIYRATGQSLRPTPPPPDTKRKTEKQTENLNANSDSISQKRFEKIVAENPCNYGHDSMFEQLQRSTLHYRLGDAYMSMGNLTAGQTKVLNEYCARYGVRDMHRWLCLLHDMLDQADRGLVIDAQLLKYNYLLCKSQISDSLLKPSNCPPTITSDEMERYKVVRKRVENYLLRQITYFWYCYPFGRPKGNFKSTLGFLDVFNEDIGRKTDDETEDESDRKSYNPGVGLKLITTKSEDKTKAKSESRTKSEDKSDEAKETKHKSEEKKKKETSEKISMRLLVRKCFYEGAHMYHKKLMENYSLAGEETPSANQLVKVYIKLSEDAGEALYQLPVLYKECYEWFNHELQTYGETVLSLLNRDLEKLVRQHSAEFRDLFSIFFNLARIFKSSKLWKTSVAKTYLNSIFTPVLVDHFEATQTSIRNAIAKDCSKKSWKSSNFAAAATAALSILKRLEAIITFMRDLNWTDEVYANSVEHNAKSTAASLIQDMLTSISQNFTDQRSSMRSGFDTTMTPAIMDLINYAIMAKEYIVKLCGAGRDFAGKVKFYHKDLEASVNDCLKSMTDAITEKFNMVLRETLLDKLARYDDGSLAAGFMRISNTSGFDLLNGYMTFVCRNQEIISEGISDYTFVSDLYQQWYTQGLQRLETWIDSRNNFTQHQLKVTIVFFKKFCNEFATQGIDVQIGLYRKVVFALEAEEKTFSVQNQLWDNDGISIEDLVKSERDKIAEVSKRKREEEASKKAEKSEKPGDQAESGDPEEVNQQETPKTKKKVFPFKIKKPKKGGSPESKPN